MSCSDKQFPFTRNQELNDSHFFFRTGCTRPRARSLNPPQPVLNFGRKGYLWEDETHSRLENLFIPELLLQS